MAHYTTINFKSKKALRDAIAAGKKVEVFQPGPFGKGIETGTMRVYLEGPHYPEPHRWYGQGEIVDGALVKVK